MYLAAHMKISKKTSMLGFVVYRDGGQWLADADGWLKAEEWFF